MSAVGGAVRATGKTIKWLLILGALIVVVVIVAMIFSLGSAVSDDEQAAKDFAVVAPRVTLGMTREQVRALAGAPSDTQRQQSSLGVTVYWYYGVLAKDGWQLVFEDGKLRAKNRG